jgi:hypothetical protein
MTSRFLPRIRCVTPTAGIGKFEAPTRLDAEAQPSAGSRPREKARAVVVHKHPSARHGFGGRKKGNTVTAPTALQIQYAIAFFSAAAAILWFASTLVSLQAWREVSSPGTSIVLEIALNSRNPKQWYYALKKQSRLNAAAAACSGLAAILFAYQTWMFPPS